MKIEIPELALVLLVGPSGSGKSTFAARHFLPTEVISSDACRAIVRDDESDQSATSDAFELVHFIARKRLRAGRLSVIDATNVQPESRKTLVELARSEHCLVVAIVLDLPTKLAIARHEGRPNRPFGPEVIARQAGQLRRSLRSMRREGFHRVHVLGTPEEVEAAEIVRTKLWCDRRDERGPFDIVGDVHGCREELEALLAKLGYARRHGGAYAHPEGRRAIFLGDLVDRGPDSPGVLRIVMEMVRAGTALAVAGNHDVKLEKKLRGRDVKVGHGLERTLAQLEAEDEAFKAEVAEFIEARVSHYVLAGGKLVVAHGGLEEELQGRASGAVRQFALYGETTGEVDEYGLPVRHDWAQEYRGRAMVVYGHTPVLEPEWVNGTLCIDTGCVFGGSLTALRYPEREIVQVRAERVHYEPQRPLEAKRRAPSRPEDLLDIRDVTGKRVVHTRLHGNSR